MSFQILDENKKPINLEILDQHACKLWNVKIDKKWWASPPNDGSYKEKVLYANWFDKIGASIHYDKLETWLDIKLKFLKPFEELFKYDGITELNDKITSLSQECPEYGCYFELIKFWEDKGYTPKYVEDY